MADPILAAFLYICISPVLALITLVVVLAAIGRSVGIRKAYVGLLLNVFEFCKYKVPVIAAEDESDSEDEEFEDKGESSDTLNSSTLTSNGDIRVIYKDYSLTATKGLQRPDWIQDDYKKHFELSDVLNYSKCGLEAIIDDDVTKRFSAEELTSWNLLTRTQKNHQFMTVRLTILWGVGCFIRYFILFPFRVLLVAIGISWLITTTAIIGYLKDSSFKRALNRYTSLTSFRILCRACSGVINFHNRENMAQNGICVANHTSPIDVLMLSVDNCYAMIGQSHGGFLGLLQRSLGRATAHIWFERSEIKDRSLVARRLRSHIEDPTKLPILIFPEGTCINNTSVMMFKKGSFEVDSVIYPVAIKYDPRFGDAFWNSSKQSWTQHLVGIMSSWALVCDIWYLPPMKKKEGEDAVTFANRVKSVICSKGGLVDLDWDGGLKRANVKDSMKELPQEQYSKLLKVD